MTADDQPIAVTLTVQQWREIKADMDISSVSGAWLALQDQLGEYDLAGDDCPGDDCSCGGGR